MNDDMLDGMFMMMITLFGFFCGIAVGVLVLSFMGIGESLAMIFFGVMMGILGVVVLIVGIIRFLYLFKVVRRE